MSSRRIPIAAKLYGGFALVLALTIVVGVLAISKMGAINTQADEVSTVVVPSVKAVELIRAKTGDYRRSQLRHIIADDQPGMKEELADMAAADAAIDEQFKLYEPLVSNAEDEKLLRGVEEKWAAYQEQSAGFEALSERNDFDGAVAELEGDAEETWDALKADIQAWSDLNTDMAAESEKATDDTYAAARTLTIALLAIAIALGAALAFLITRGIRRNVAEVLDRLATLRERDTAELSRGLTAFADGDLTVEVAPVTEPIDSWSNDELGDVAQAVNLIRDNTHASMDAYNGSRAALSSILGDVSSTASSVSAASQQMASTSQEAGRAVTEIASAVGDVAQGAERQVQMVDGARSAAEQSQQAAGDARHVAQEGATAAEQATDAMSAVRASSAEVTAAIRALAGKSSEISGIVATITGIAEQTNLLALNAAIEAARAGEQGRGFAVVAEEVRKLAEESQTAAGSISGLIDEIQTETDHAVTVVESGAARSDEGAAVVEQARAAFAQITAAVEGVGERIEQI
ncbi:MAG TPA: methyl-accepting chemotaxis protein, partial [Capillimicrobium sp.]